MEKFFRPVRGSSEPAGMKQRHHLRRRDPESHRFTPFDDAERNSEENRERRYPGRGHYRHADRQDDTRRRQQIHQTRHVEEDEILDDENTPVSLSGASCSGLSSSSSSVSSSSWFTEASANDPFSLRHLERPRHSLSCSDIAEVRGAFQEDDSTEPIAFASVTHGARGNGVGGQRGRAVYSSLDRNHSRSEEGLPKGNEGRKQGGAPYSGAPYETSGLNRSLTFSDEDLLVGDSRGPKRAVSSGQLPGKGILKNKKPHADIRKAKSLEVISPRVPERQDPRPGGREEKGTARAEMEQARAHFVQGKLQFSAFLDEITKQVISPSYLTILGVNDGKVTDRTGAPLQTLDPVKPELPPKKHRKSSGEEREHHPQQHSGQDKSARSISPKDSDKLISYAARNHQGSPPPHRYAYSSGRNAHRGKSHKDQRLSPIGGSLTEDGYGRCGSQLSDGTGTSPELSRPEPRHRYERRIRAFYSTRAQNLPKPRARRAGVSASQRGPNTSPPSSDRGARTGLGSESSSSRSDSTGTADASAATASRGSERSGRHRPQHLGSAKQCGDRLCDAERLRALQEENTDLQQNLLQTVVCIESLESELQRTRDELGNVKDKYKSLLETHAGTGRASELLGERLHIASESRSGERKYLLDRVSQLSSELEGAHGTVAALENIIDLPEKHFKSAEAARKIQLPAAIGSHSAISPSALKPPQPPKSEETARDRRTETETATAFVPFEREVPKTVGQISLRGPLESSNGPPLSAEDIGAAIYRKIRANYTAKPQTNLQRPSLGEKYPDRPLKPQRLHRADRSGEKGEVSVTLLERDAADATAASAQRILDEFTRQLRTREGGG